jgi:dolichyl-phosphate-mannose-protein mannosyltransferase
MARRLAWTSLGIVVVSAALFLFRIGQPPVPVYDEPNYVGSARTFVAGTRDSNPEHPPFAKYLIAAGIKLAGDNPLGWRIAGVACGSLTLVAVFLWTYLLLADYTLALIAACFTLFNNFLFVMARTAMLDVFFFAFVMWGILAFTVSLMPDEALQKAHLPPLSARARKLLILACGVLFGLGGACKWTAVVTLAAVALVAAVLYFLNQYGVRRLGIPTLFVGLCIVPLVTYFLAYWPLFREMHMPFTLHGFTAMNAYIWQYHILCPGNPALNVPWYDWLFRTTPERALSYMMGNFFVVWGGFAALVYCGIRFLRNGTLALAEGMVVLFYGVNLLQWVIIPQKLTCYYYYYPPAMFLGVALVIFLGRMNQPRIAGVRISVLLLTGSVIFFLYCYPHMVYLEAPFDCALGCWS